MAQAEASLTSCAPCALPRLPDAEGGTGGIAEDGQPPGRRHVERLHEHLSARGLRGGGGVIGAGHRDVGAPRRRPPRPPGRQGADPGHVTTPSLATKYCARGIAGHRPGPGVVPAEDRRVEALGGLDVGAESLHPARNAGRIIRRVGSSLDLLGLVVLVVAAPPGVGRRLRRRRGRVLPCSPGGRAAVRSRKRPYAAERLDAAAVGEVGAQHAIAVADEHAEAEASRRRRGSRRSHG